MKLKRLLSTLFSRSRNSSDPSFEESRPALGALVLLVFLTLLLVIIGERALADIRDGVPDISYPEFRNLPEELKAREFYTTSVRPVSDRLHILERRTGQLRTEYDSSLLENIAGEEKRLYGTEEDISNQFRELEEELSKVQVTYTQLQSEYKVLLDAAEAARKPALEGYEWKMKIREAHVFFWQALLLIPFFFLALFWHTRHQNSRSAWEKVSLSVLIVSSILSIQTLCIFIWSWIPKELLEKLWEILKATLFTRVLGHGILIFLSIVIIGGLFVFVTKFLRSELRLKKKRILHSLCPSCSYPLAQSRAYCGGCGDQLQHECPSCSQKIYSWQSHCQSCGKRLKEDGNS